MTNNLLTLDPGLRDPGVARFIDGKLQWATCVRKDTGKRGPEQWQAIAHAVARAVPMIGAEEGTFLVVEKPQVYGGKHPDDLIELSASLGACVSAISETLWMEGYKAYFPREWKGQVPKTVHHRRIRKKLTGEENAILDRCLAKVVVSLQHNVLDAVGLGMFHLRRIR